MRAAFVCLFSGFVVAACATGTTGDDNAIVDSGPKTDASKTDTGAPPKDSGTPPKDSGGTPETQPCGGNCGSSTCCNNTCVDTSSDPSNCGSCGSPCAGSLSCCSSSCVDTMGSDTSNCGNCGVVCSGTCVSGTCQTSCTLDLGSCSHSVCKTGSALPEDCDISEYDITYYVCDPSFDGLTSCCTSSWTSTCVSDADFWLSLFGLTCSGC